MLEEWPAGLTELPEAITIGLPPIHKILKVQHSFNKDIAGVNIRGRIDLATKDKILDAKLGEIRERDKVQMSIYLRALNFEMGELIQFGYHKKGPERILKPRELSITPSPGQLRLPTFSARIKRP